MVKKIRFTIDTEWNENLKRLQGKSGIDILVNDREDILSKIIKALKNMKCLPSDLDNPNSEDEAWAVDYYARSLYDLFCEGAEIAEAMMVGADVEKSYNDIQDEKGNTRNMYEETGHKRSDF